MTAVILQLAARKDAVWIADMSRRLVEVGLPWSWTQVRVAHHIQHRDSIVLTARAAAVPAGFAIMQFGDDTAHLNLLAIEPPFQRQGIARALLKWLEESASTAGSFILTLEVRAQNVAGRLFYRSLGYEERACIRGYYQGVDAAIRMTRDLRVQKPLAAGSNPAEGKSRYV
jgi:ribosomal protein S18 acetylase RimI-like enzyme